MMEGLGTMRGAAWRRAGIGGAAAGGATRRRENAGGRFCREADTRGGVIWRVNTLPLVFMRYNRRFFVVDNFPRGRRKNSDAGGKRCVVGKRVGAGYFEWRARTRKMETARKGGQKAGRHGGRRPRRVFVPQ